MIFSGTTTRIPEELLLAHQEGKVVFFCGAGISRCAGIPLFDKLVSKSARAVGVALEKEERKLIERGGCDTVYQRIETRIGPANRLQLRRATATLLKPKTKDEAVLSYHFALLQLSVVRDGERLHLVTTNYDGLFDEAASRLKASHRLNKEVASYVAPLLPIPKESKWDGLVYLHGKLDGTESESNLNSLVLSSGDFGVAYLTERWASRFVTELFRTYTVCFVGYSANDAIIRYIIDAFAADSFVGETERKIYAFDGYEKGGMNKLEEAWKMKGVDVIPFRKENKDDYSELERTLTAWSDCCSLGINGPSRIILDEAVRTPSTINPEDKASIERVLWALRSSDGLAARQFSELTPPPPLEWFDVFRDVSIRESQQYRADVRDGKNVKPPIVLIPIANCAESNESSRYILDWFAKYLSSPLLLNKISSLPRPLSPALIDFFEGKILESKDLKMPVALRKLWLLWLESERKVIPRFLDLNGECQLRVLMKYRDCSGGDKLAADIIEPKLNITPRTLYDSTRFNDELVVQDVVSWEYYVGASGIIHCKNCLPDDVLESLPSTLVHPLEDALGKLCDMRREMGDEQDELDYDSLSLQDVSGPIDEANSHCPQWATLVVLLRYAWLNLLKANHKDATSIAKAWFDSPHPIFKRMALFAATQDNSINPNQVVKWLVKKSQRLFGDAYCRETLDFLAACGKSLDRVAIRSLDFALSIAPEGMSARRCNYHRAIRLDRLIDAGVDLPDNGQRFYNDWISKYPQWLRRQKKYDGLVSWISDEPDPTWEDAPICPLPPMPSEDIAIIDWLKKYYEDGGVCERLSVRRDRRDEWNDFCQNDIVHAYMILRDAFGLQLQLKTAWRILLNAAVQKERALTLWNFLQSGKDGSQLMLDVAFDRNQRSVAEWFRTLSEQGVDITGYLDFAKVLFGRSSNDAEVFKIIMEGVLRRWYATEPKEDGGIVSPFREFFALVAHGYTFAARSARIELLTQLSNLTLVDKEWTFSVLTPVLSWKSKDAQESWKAAIKMTWRNADLMEHIKGDFIETAKHFNELDDGSKWYAHIVVLMGISKNKGYGPASFMKILRDLPGEGRLQVAYDIQNRLHNSIDKIDACWKDEIGPFIKRMWPAEAKCMTPKIAGVLFVGMAYCNTAFHDAAQTLLNLYGGHVEMLDVAARLCHPPHGSLSRCKLFPNEVLDVLFRVDTDKRDYSVALNIKKCLDEIRDVSYENGDGTYESDVRYQKLLEFVMSYEFGNKET